MGLLGFSGLEAPWASASLGEEITGPYRSWDGFSVTSCFWGQMPPTTGSLGSGRARRTAQDHMPTSGCTPSDKQAPLLFPVLPPHPAPIPHRSLRTEHFLQAPPPGAFGSDLHSPRVKGKEARLSQIGSGICRCLDVPKETLQDPDDQLFNGALEQTSEGFPGQPDGLPGASLQR